MFHRSGTQVNDKLPWNSPQRNSSHSKITLPSERDQPSSCPQNLSRNRNFCGRMWNASGMWVLSLHRGHADFCILPILASMLPTEHPTPIPTSPLGFAVSPASRAKPPICSGLFLGQTSSTELSAVMGMFSIHVVHDGNYRPHVAVEPTPCGQRDSESEFLISIVIHLEVNSHMS